MSLYAFLSLYSLISAAIVIPFERDHNNVKRGSESAQLHSDGVGYYINFTLGGQDLVSQVDTGSSDIWVPENTGCTKSKFADCVYVYDTSASNTFKPNESEPFRIKYADDSAAIGYMAQDTFVLGSATVTGMNFALATQASANSVFGIGLPAGEAMVVSSSENKPYSNLPFQLKEQGLIDSAAYSFWFGDPGKYNGEIVFGGVDHSRYNGDLVTVPIEKQPLHYYRGGTAEIEETPSRFLVMVNRLAIEVNGASTAVMEGVYPALLDTGSTTSHGPAGLVRAINRHIGEYSSSKTMGCGVPDGNLVVTIRGEDFRIPLSTLITSMYTSDTVQIAEPDGDLVCRPPFTVTSDSTYFAFGDNILRGLYLVYDLDKQEISIAQSNYNAGEAKVEDISGGTVPSARKAKDYASSVDRYSLRYASWPSAAFSASDIKTRSGDNAAITTAGGARSAFLSTRDFIPGATARSRVDNDDETTISEPTATTSRTELVTGSGTNLRSSTNPRSTESTSIPITHPGAATGSSVTLRSSTGSRSTESSAVPTSHTDLVSSRGLVSSRLSPSTSSTSSALFNGASIATCAPYFKIVFTALYLL